MALTRNLYREDEVVAAFRWWASRGRADDTLFWAKEMLDSGMRYQLWESMLWVWLHTVGIADPYWLEIFCGMNDQTSDTAALCCAAALLRHPRERRDATVVALLGLGLAPVNDFVGQPVLPPVEALHPAATTALKAIVQGKTAFAWSLLRPFWEDTAWTVLKAASPTANWQSLLRTHAERFPSLAWSCRAAALVLTAYPAPKPPIAPWTPPTEWLDTVHTLEGLEPRARRVKIIPPACLFLTTARGRLSVIQSTEEDLMIPLEGLLHQSPFWSPLLPMPGDDDAREAFFQNWFPDDIPDEWSPAARQVSHGRGVIPHGTPDPKIMLHAALDRWFGIFPSRVWDGLATGLDELVAKWPEDGNHPASLWTGLGRIVEGTVPTIPPEALLSARRRFVL